MCYIFSRLRFQVFWFLGVIAACCPYHAFGQVFYAAGIDINSGLPYVYKINAITCAVCEVTPASNNVPGSDIIILPDGNQLILFQGPIKRLEDPPSVSIVWQGIPPNIYNGGVLAPNGLVYMGGPEGLGSFNPVGNIVTYLGNWPAAWGLGTCIELYYLSGQLYGTWNDSNTGTLSLIQVNITDPSQSILLNMIPYGYFGEMNGVWNGVEGLFYLDVMNDLAFYDPVTGLSTFLCDLPNGIVVASLATAPPGVPEFGCVLNCSTNAGVLPAGSVISACINLPLNPPSATQTTLDGNDLLQYILFTNPADTAGSIIAVSNTPSFVFDPATMSTGTTYYFAAMAGNNVGGNVDINDPCLDFSNARQVIWKPLPAVTFAATNTDVCIGGCINVNLSFTGTPPFTLTYINPLTGPQTASYSALTGVVTICPPANSPPGSLVLAATALTDGMCTCQ